MRDRSVSTPTLRRADMIPPIEIAEAIMKVLRDNGALDAQDIPKAVAQLFGFQRTGSEFSSVVVAVSDRMMREGRILDGPSGLICS